ncbi:agglutination protein [Vibrio inusitatus NBRC 102082]|uniref:Agglutination protein n=1 Tax=Vibrio inusitatus NBRC 102082 TaxID=1219070 RepID=A0A4Y3HTV2_9VIBR|nr:TolC family outer membrane protein [Vibrio inusitatus]GEA50182.1 agglutination protein [Vibrio inusitatus NBRC 102082]
MKRIKLSAIALATMLCNPASAQSLEQAISYTLQTNPTVKSSYNEFMSYVYENKAAVREYYPKLDLSAGIGWENYQNDLTNRDDDYTAKDASLTFTQLIWDGSNTLNNMDRTAAEAESLRYKVLSDASDISLEVAKVYLDALKAYEILALSESNLATHKEIFKDIKKRTDSGIGSTADLSQVEARIAKAHGNLLAAQNNLFDTHTQFTRLVGQSPQGLVFPRADETTIPFTLSEAIDTALEKHPVIKTAKVDVDAAKFQYKQSNSPNLPTFTVEAGYNYYDDAEGVGYQRDEMNATLRMKYNLFNGGVDSANKDRAAYQMNKSKDLRDRAYRNVEESLRLSWSALDLTLQQKEFLADHVDAASDTVVAYDKQYKIGKRTLLDLLNTENELFESRKGYVDALYAEQYAKFRVLNATGTLLESLLVDVPEEWNEAVEY